MIANYYVWRDEVLSNISARVYTMHLINELLKQNVQTTERYYHLYNKYTPYCIKEGISSDCTYFVEVLYDKRCEVVTICDVIVTSYNNTNHKSYTLYDSTKRRRNE